MSKSHLKQKPLGATGLTVSEICLGTMQFGWYMDERASFSMLDRFLESGGNFLDTADMYSNWAPDNPGGVSEQIIGRWMKERRNRNSIVLATKCRGKMWEGWNGEGLSRSHIFRACEDSLRRLQTDVIDLYQSHWDDDVVPQEETMVAFDSLVRQGKVRRTGCSNFSADRLQSALDISNSSGLAAYAVIQPQYNLAYREDYEKATRAVCEKSGIVSIPYSPLGGGLLTAKYHLNQKPDTHRADYVSRYASKKADRIILRMIEMAKSLDLIPLQIALRWVMAQPTVASPIIGASSSAQLEGILDSVSADIPASILDELTRISG